MRTKITVVGMGGCINFEMKLIQKALENVGIKVIVNNDAEDWVCSNEPNYMDNVTKALIKQKYEGKQCTVELTAEHTPWGG